MRINTKTFVLIGMALLFTACSSFRRHPEAPKNPTPEVAAAPAAAVEEKPTDKAMEKLAEKPVEKAAKEGDVKSHWPTHPDKPVTLSEEAPGTPGIAKDKPVVPLDVPVIGVPWDKSLSWLKNGNTRFAKGYFRKDGQAMADIKRLERGQKPHAIVLSCSDSRVPPELVFDQKLGEIFVVRNAGPNLDNTALASIEYAMKAFNPHLLLVMGHNHCGAIQGAMATFNNSDAGSPALNQLVAAMHPRLLAFRDHPSSDGNPEAWANTTGVARELIEKSAMIKAGVEDGSFKVQTAVYDLGNGKVDFDGKR